MENLDYNELELKYLELFDKLPPEYVGVNKKHPIYLKMLQESISNNRELNLNEFEQEVKKTNDIVNNFSHNPKRDIVKEYIQAERLFKI